MFFRVFWVKLTQFEYWNWKVFYFPLLPYYLFLSLKNRSFAFPSVVNTALRNGGFFDENKKEILQNIPPAYLPITYYTSKKDSFETIFNGAIDTGLNFPLIAKPLDGQRGKNVELIHTKSDLKKYWLRMSDEFMIQEFVDYEIELGVFYARKPNNCSGKVSSVTIKEFLSVTGDGISTIEELLNKKERSLMVGNSLFEKIKININTILPKGKTEIIEPIGNHCRGTEFKNANYLDLKKIILVCDEILKDFKGFNYGRFDLKVKTIDDLYKGENIKIIELNGVNADCAHIYDSKYTLLKAYKDICSHWKILSEIAQFNKKMGFSPIDLNHFFLILKSKLF